MLYGHRIEMAFALAPFGQGVDSRGEKLSLISLQTNPLTKVSEVLEKKGNILYHTKQWIFRKDHINL